MARTTNKRAHRGRRLAILLLSAFSLVCAACAGGGPHTSKQEGLSKTAQAPAPPKPTESAAEQSAQTDGREPLPQPMSKRDTAPPNPLSKVQELSPDCTPRSTCYGPLWCQLIALECSSLFKVSLSFSNASFAVHEITPGMALTEGRELTLVEFADEQEPQKRQLSIWPKRERLMEVQKWGDLLLLSGTTTVHPGLHIWSYDLAAGKQRWQSQLGQLKSQRHARSVPPPFEDRLKLKAIALIARKKLVDWRNRCMTSSVGCSGREGPALPQELSFLLQKRQACAGSPDCKQDSLASTGGEYTPGSNGDESDGPPGRVASSND